MARKFAEGTSVAPETSKAEIERMLARYGCTSFASGWDEERAVIVFQSGGRRVRFTLQMPDKSYPASDDQPRGWWTWGDAKRKEWVARRNEAEIRRRWRALALTIKAKLEAVASEISSFDEEFLAHFVTGDGRTVGEVVLPQLAQLDDMPLMLGAGPS